MKLDRETVHSLKQNNMTFAQIASMFGVTPQRAWTLYSGYESYYHKTDRYRMYKRHRGHTLSTKLVKPCELCVNEKKINGVERINY